MYEIIAVSISFVFVPSESSAFTSLSIDSLVMLPWWESVCPELESCSASSLSDMGLTLDAKQQKLMSDEVKSMLSEIRLTLLCIYSTYSCLFVFR